MLGEWQPVRHRTRVLGSRPSFHEQRLPLTPFGRSGRTRSTHDLHMTCPSDAVSLCSTQATAGIRVWQGRFPGPLPGGRGRANGGSRCYLPGPCDRQVYRLGLGPAGGHSPMTRVTWKATAANCLMLRGLGGLFCEAGTCRLCRSRAPPPRALRARRLTSQRQKGRRRIIMEVLGHEDVFGSSVCFLNSG